jgi:hypothetical protein
MLLMMVMMGLMCAGLACCWPDREKWNTRRQKKRHKQKRKRRKKKKRLRSPEAKFCIHKSSLFDDFFVFFFSLQEVNLSIKLV